MRFVSRKQGLMKHIFGSLKLAIFQKMSKNGLS
jgi:hypothetical protein